VNGNGLIATAPSVEMAVRLAEDPAADLYASVEEERAIVAAVGGGASGLVASVEVHSSGLVVPCLSPSH
jgi:hypothetical protein